MKILTVNGAFIVAGLSLFLMGCAPVLLGAGGSTSYVATQERSFEEAGADIALKAIVWEKVGRLNGAYVKDLSIRVRLGEVFVTGVVKEASELNKITHTAEQVKGVKNVINLAQLKPYPVKQYFKDVAIGTSLKSRLVFAKDVYTANYEINVIKSEAYLFGWAYTKAEVEKATHLTSTTNGIKKVHNYLKIMPNGAAQLQKIKDRAEQIRNEKYGVDEVK